MATDAWGLCDHLGIEQVNLFGVSMGGMIVQQMAIDRPERVAGSTSVMSTTGDPDVGQPEPAALSALIAPAPTERDAYPGHALEHGRVLAGSEHIDEDWVVERNALAFDRGINPDGSSVHLLALLVSPSRSAGLRLARRAVARDPRRDRPRHHDERRGAHGGVPARVGVPADSREWGTICPGTTGRP